MTSPARTLTDADVEREDALRGIAPWPRPAVIVERRDLLP